MRVLNLTEIQAVVIYLMGGEPVNLATISKYTNDVMDELSFKYNTACLKKSKSVVCSSTLASTAMETDCIGVYKIVDSAGDKYNDFTIDDDGILFGSTGTYTVKYYAKPVMATRTNTDVAMKTDVPPINSAYHKCIPKFIAAEIIKIINPKDKRIEAFMADCSQDAKDADSRLRNMKRKNRRVYAPAWV